MPRIVRLTGSHPGLAKGPLATVLREECRLGIREAKRHVDDLLRGQILRFELGDDEAAEALISRARRCRAVVDTGSEEDPLLEAARGYVYAAEQSKGLRRSRASLPDAEHALTTSVASYVSDLLVGEPDWPEGGWVDDVQADAVSLPAPDTVELRGALLWADSGAGQWIEPLATSLRLSADADRILSLQIHVGDAAAGLRHLPRDSRRSDSRSDVRTWIFSFGWDE
jgi:hypothetical protein